jgi:cytochrome c-type biogenesis protein CcmE
MKKLHIVGLLIIAVGIVSIIFLTKDYTTYENFKTAKDKGSKEIQIVGELVLNKEIFYDPKKDPNYFSFFMKDKQGEISKVVFKGSEPNDFRRSEQVVVTGKMENQCFHASKILMKCPSKYVNKEIQIAQEVKK